MEETILIMKRLVNFIRVERAKPRAVTEGMATEAIESSRQTGRLEVCNSLLDFIHGILEEQRGNDAIN